MRPFAPNNRSTFGRREQTQGGSRPERAGRNDGQNPAGRNGADGGRNDGQNPAGRDNAGNERNAIESGRN